MFDKIHVYLYLLFGEKNIFLIMQQLNESMCKTQKQTRFCTCPIKYTMCIMIILYFYLHFCPQINQFYTLWGVKTLK